VDVLNKKVVLSWIFSHVFLLILLLFEIETTPGINCKQVEQLLKKTIPKTSYHQLIAETVEAHQFRLVFLLIPTL